MRTRKRTRRSRSTAGAVLQFAIGGMAALALVTLGAVLVLRHAGKNEAIRDARTQSRVIASGIIEPVLKDRAAGSEAARLAELAHLTKKPLEAAGVVRVKLWDKTGKILYSDEPRLVGRQYDLEADDLAVLERGGSSASVTDLSAPENQFEPRGRSLLQVYRQVHTADGKPLLLETYFPYRSVTSVANRIIREFAPIAIGAMVLLALIQIPLAWSMARSIRASQREREVLLERAADASTTERQRIAGDLHDGVVQDLTGVSFSIAGALEGLNGAAAPRVEESLQDAAEGTRRGIRQLRSLLVDLYPPNLQSAGLEAALSDLLARVSNPGVRARLSYDPGRDLSIDEEALVFRTTQEALRNVRSHSQATEVRVAVHHSNGQVLVTIADDGLGFNVNQVQGEPDGHLGLRLMEDLATNAGAKLEVQSVPTRGTTVELALGGPS